MDKEKMVASLESAIYNLKENLPKVGNGLIPLIAMQIQTALDELEKEEV